MRVTYYSRQRKHGRKTWYYRIVDEEGNRTSGINTHYTSKRAAQDYVNAQITKLGSAFWKQKSKIHQSFNEYAKDWLSQSGVLSGNLSQPLIVDDQGGVNRIQELVEFLLHARRDLFQLLLVALLPQPLNESGAVVEHLLHKGADVLYDISDASQRKAALLFPDRVIV